MNVGRAIDFDRGVFNLDYLWSQSREAQIAFADLMASRAKIKRHPLIGYWPHRKQHAFHASDDQIKAFFGGNQSGKTTAGLIDDIIQALDAADLPAHLRGYKRWQPPFHCRIAGPDFVQTMEKVILKKLRDWIPPAALKGGGWDAKGGGYSDSERLLRFKNGSTFEFMTYEQDRDKWGGSTLHRVHYDEEPPEHLRQEGQARLLKHDGDELFTMTPSLEGTEGWTQDAIWDRRQEAGIFAERVDMEDNPHLAPTAVATFLATLSEAERAARKEGKFIHYAGMVYGAFNDQLHTRDPITPTHLEGQSKIIAIDPGTRWTGVAFCGFDSDNDMIVYDELILAAAQDSSKMCEIYPNGVTADIAVARIKEKCEQWGFDLESADRNNRPIFVIDPSGRNRQGPNAEQWEAEYARFGIFCGHAQNAVEAGTTQINRRFQRKIDGQPVPGITITRNCRRIIWEIGRYKVKETPDGKFEVVKHDDHCVDAVRYAAMERPWLTGLEGRTKGYDNWNPNPTPAQRLANVKKPTHWSLA